MINILDKQDCCGCSACIQVCPKQCITMLEDKEGFLYPQVNTYDCIDCHLCEKVCPVLHSGKPRKPLNVYAAKNKDEKIRLQSSSGGVFSSLAEAIINAGGVVFGAKFDEEWKVVHGYTETKDGIADFRGSKYVQSWMGDNFSKVKYFLDNGRKVLFSGTPCQVAGLKRFLRKPYENLLTVDLVCHAVPSPLIYKQYINMCSTKLGQKVMSINMRYKQTYGWSHRFSYCFYFENGQKAVDPVWVVNWGKIFFSQMINRPSCHSCKYSNLDRPGDFTIADFWDDKKNRPDLYSCEGTSLLMVNTNMGLDLINKLYDSIDLWKITKDEAMQPCLIRPTCSNQRRQEFWEFYLLRGFDAAYKKYFGDSKYVITKKIVKQIIKRVLRKLQ